MTHGLSWPRLIQGTLIRRYKRFLADVRLRNGHVVTAHCPNSGSMKGCSEPGRPVYLSRAANPLRKLKYTWELIHMEASLVGVNTMIPNRLVRRGVENSLIPELTGYGHVQAEVPYGRNSRIDLLLSNGETSRCYVEIKNCTLVEHDTAYFPDAVTARGLKHLFELQACVNAGHRAVVFFLVQREDARYFRSARRIDPQYSDQLRIAVNGGVEIIAYDVHLNLGGIHLRHPIACFL